MRAAFKLPVIIVSFLLTAPVCLSDSLSVPDDELARIGRLIYMNEAGGKPDNLTAWNDGEEFASLGIGHFLWYPKGKQYAFRETFPALIDYMKSEGVPIPPWLNELEPFDLPWDTRGEFYRDFNSPKMTSLRELLLDTMPVQTAFIAERLRQSLPTMLDAAPPALRGNIRKQFYRVADSEMGMYVLIDYVNFKGEGVLETERYNGQGWGLLQVLANMKSTATGRETLREFASSAEAVLVRRVKNSPPERNEKRWLPGWKNRLKTYTDDDLYGFSGVPALALEKNGAVSLPR